MSTSVGCGLCRTNTAFKRFVGYDMLAAAVAIAEPVQASALGFVEFEGDDGNSAAPGYFTFQVVESPDGKVV
jgi:hypothetical protein